MVDSSSRAETVDHAAWVPYKWELLVPFCGGLAAALNLRTLLSGSLHREVQETEKPMGGETDGAIVEQDLLYIMRFPTHSFQCSRMSCDATIVAT